MTQGLRRYYGTRHLHFITCSLCGHGAAPRPRTPHGRHNPWSDDVFRWSSGVRKLCIRPGARTSTVWRCK